IGKAKALKKRVSQYFLRFDHHEGKVRKMVEHVDHFDTIITDSEFEALVLECSLIKQHKPKYNILLKDDKGYSYIRITLDEQWPRIYSVKRKDEDGATYLGPYISSFAVKEAVDEAVKAFALPVCGRRFPQDIGKGRPCLNYFIRQCCAPCRGKISNAEYRETIENAVLFLRGGYGLILEQLEDKMNQASENLEFEKAARMRERITAIKKIREKQKVVASRVEEQDVVAAAGDGCATVFEVFLIRSGRLTDREEFVVDYLQDEKAARAEFIQGYYTLRKKAPKQITLDGETEDRGLLEEYLTRMSGRKIRITVPQKGGQKNLAVMARTNACEKLSQLGARPGREEKTLEELQALLGMKQTPSYIEAYDISNTAGSGMVAGMVVFENGQPKKSAYKKFSVKSVTGPDDYASMREVVGRRLARLREAVDQGRTESAGFARVPDLILLDGGRGHVAAVKPVLEEYGFDIPLFGMVKDNSHRTRAIAQNGGEISINSNRQVFTLISKIQDEVHRFAIAYHHKTQSRKGLSSALIGAPQIGEKRARALMRHFKTMEKIRKASIDELSEADGMNHRAAAALKVWLENQP
ncbi:MAG TPA: excinuclease ABC subunit UvrC, partial [Clostridia bacterium]|nr:excinuclease ABC subunit UvrC [Clostridia bacterium]